MQVLPERGVDQNRDNFRRIFILPERGVDRNLYSLDAFERSPPLTGRANFNLT